MAMVMLVFDDLFDSHINKLDEASIFSRDVFHLDAKHFDCDHDAGNEVTHEMRRRDRLTLTPGGAAAM